MYEHIPKRFTKMCSTKLFCIWKKFIFYQYMYVCFVIDASFKEFVDVCNMFTETVIDILIEKVIDIFIEMITYLIYA